MDKGKGKGNGKKWVVEEGWRDFVEDFRDVPIPVPWTGGVNDGSGARGVDRVEGFDQLSKEEEERSVNVNENGNSGTVVDGGVSVLEMGSVS